MTFAENLNRICTEKGISLTTLVKTIKGSSSFATAINRGSLPKESEMVDMAKILGCSVIDFFSDEGELHEVETADEDENDILRIYRGLPRRAKHEFMARMYAYQEMLSKESETE